MWIIGLLSMPVSRTDWCDGCGCGYVMWSTWMWFAPDMHQIIYSLFGLEGIDKLMKNEWRGSSPFKSLSI